MKKIFIIGKNSYIGQHIKERFSRDDQYTVEEVDAIDDAWKNTDFSYVEAIIHVAGIVHRPDISDWEIYKSVNIDLPVEIAKVAKLAGVKQFVFFSTMGVYGIDKKLSLNIINKDTIPQPTSMYGKSKYDAEIALKDLEDESFKITIVRPPNVYGKDCRGGYIKGFAAIVRKIPFIPMAYNNVRQSVIYIDNLSELIYLLINTGRSGTFMPQDDRPVSATELMQLIAVGLGIRRNTSKFWGIFVPLLAWTPIARKAYGGIEYSADLSNIDGLNYRVTTVESGIERSV